MKTYLARYFVASLALLCSSVGLAATVTVTTSNDSPNVGDSFTLTLSVADMVNTAGPTLELSYDSSVVSFTSMALPDSGPFAATSGTFLVQHLPTFDILLASPFTGSDTFLTMTFQAVSAGDANIQILDDGGATTGWFDADTFDPIPTTYDQAVVTVMSVAGPNIDVTDSVDPPGDADVGFGYVDLAVDATETVTVTNTGTADLTISSVTAPGGDFSLDDNCTGVVPAAGSCTITVHFIPTAYGPASGSFDIVSDDPDTMTVTVTLSGTGGLPNIVVTDADGVVPDDQLVQFDDVQVSLTSAVDVTITNDGPVDLPLGTITTPTDAQFTLAGNSCGAILTPAALCVVTVEFAPTATGLANGSFDINSADPDSPTITVLLSGNGTAAPTPDIAVTDSDSAPDDHAIDFGSVQVGQTSAALTVTVTNNGAADLIVSSVAGLVAPFTVTGEDCTGAPIATAATCMITVEFSPTVSGPAPAGTLTITSNDPDMPMVDVVASGNGTPVPAPHIAVTDSDAAPNDNALSFGNVPVGQTSAAITVTVSNTGDVVLSVGQIAVANPLPSPYAISNDNCSGMPVAAGATCTLEVRFAPTVGGTINEAFDIPSDDPDTASVIVNVSGTGTAPDITVTDSVAPADDLQVSLGTVNISASAEKTVTVTNDGTEDLVIGMVAMANPLAVPFSIVADSCSGQTLAPAASCTINVRFAPGVPQTFNDSFDIPSNDPDEDPVVVMVKGTGKDVGDTSGSLALDPLTLLGLGLAGFALRRRRPPGA